MAAKILDFSIEVLCKLSKQFSKHPNRCKSEKVLCWPKKIFYMKNMTVTQNYFDNTFVVLGLDLDSMFLRRHLNPLFKSTSSMNVLSGESLPSGNP